MATKRWQDQTSVLLGMWMLVSPWVLDYTGNRMLTVGMPTAPVWDALVLGVAAMLTSVFAMYMHKAWEEGLNIAIGVALLISPWVLGFSGSEVPTINATAVGLALAALGGWSMLQDPDVHHWLAEHHLAR
jgi:hypothetical protein